MLSFCLLTWGRCMIQSWDVHFGRSTRNGSFSAFSTVLDTYMFLTTVLNFSQDNTTVGDSKLWTPTMSVCGHHLTQDLKQWCLCVYLQLTISTTWVISLLNTTVLGWRALKNFYIQNARWHEIFSCWVVWQQLPKYSNRTTRLPSITIVQ